MAHINLLSPHVADLIAAGEVVERPASVIKELMENAFDAGARTVTVEIRNGGATMIRVTDDGCGMAPEDAGIAFLRHATSKLEDEHGLEAIETMGFRGEALAAISAVSRIDLITRRGEDAEGTHMTLIAGEIEEMEATGCPAGTSICVRDLFFNTPARLKFLKSDRSEASACVQAGLRCALGRPEISVRFLRDGKEEFFTPGDGTLSSACYALLGREMTAEFLPVRSSDEGLRLHGFVSSPAAGRGNRGAQYFYVNGRYIRSTLLQSALEQAYRNTLLTGRYPACVICVEIRPGAVDVNVHPAKTEVKFSDERRVFHLLHQAVQDALQAEDRVGAAGAGSAAPAAVDSEGAALMPDHRTDSANRGDGIDPAAERVDAPKSGRDPARSTQELGNTAYEQVSIPLWKSTAEPVGGDDFAARPATGTVTGTTERGADREETGPDFSQTPVGRPAYDRIADVTSPLKADLVGKPEVYEPAAQGAKINLSAYPPDNGRQPGYGAMQDRFAVSRESEWASAVPVTASGPATGKLETAAQDGVVEKPVQDVDNSSIPDHKIVGEALKTYIIVELENRLLLIDKHAAHERMNFDRLKAKAGAIPAQQLLVPQTKRVTGEELELLERFGEVFEEFGFEIEPFGEHEVILRAVPADILPEDAVPTVEELLEHLREGGTPDPAGARDELLHTVACKAAIKAGWNTGMAELERIVQEVLSGRVKYCPHGRPVSVIVTRKDLDRLFLRIV